jgi:uncharacterized protein (DUF1697 family)
MKKHCIIIFIIIFFNVFVVSRFGLEYDQVDVLSEPDDHTEKIIIYGASIFIAIVAMGIVKSKRNKLLESQTQEKSFSRNVNFVRLHLRRE